jgi:methionine synthase II (cobalamin-independent)
VALELTPGTATGVGSLPGVDPLEACRLVFGELPDLPHLPELPDRGAGADMIGRAAGFLVDLAVDLQPSGWRLVPRPGIDLRRAKDFLARDLDALEEIADGYTGPLKLQVTGPWTLAGSMELTRGDKVVADPGAVRDLRESLTEGLRAHVADVSRRVPGARLVVQLDEPSLPAVLAGRIPTASGYGTLAAVPEPVAGAALGELIKALPVPALVHCCAPGVPVDLVRTAGAAAVSLDASLLGAADDEPLGLAIEGGLTLFLGVVPGTDTNLSTVDKTAGLARRLWHRLGFAAPLLPERVVLQPACGLAGASPAYARRALARCREAARKLAAEPE